MRAGRRQLREQRFRGRFERQFYRVAAGPQLHGPDDAAGEARDDRVGHVAHDQFPAAAVERDHVGQVAARHQAAAREDRDAAAQRFGVAQHVRAEEHRAAFVAQPQNQRADVAPPQRIEPRHRFVEDDELGIVDERLRDPDALQHALRELPQRPPPLGADADLVEQAAGARAAVAHREAEQPREIHE